MNNINLTEVYENTYTSLVKYISYKTNNSKEFAEDMASETFVKAFENIDKYNSEKSTIKTWIYTIANNTIIDYYRKEKNNKITSISAFVDSEGNEFFQINSGYKTDSEAISIDIRNNINTAFSELSPKLREVAELYFYGELKYNEIAEILDITLANVKVIINRCRKQLQNTLSLAGVI